MAEALPGSIPSTGGSMGHVVRACLGALAVTAVDAALLALALGGVTALLRHPRALALLAVWAVGGVTLALARPVRTHQPVASDRESPALLIGLLLIPLATPPVSALGERFGVLPWFAHPFVEWLGVAFVAVGLAVRIAAMARLGSRFSPLVTVQRDHRLETSGLYGIVRHPGYLGSLLACGGAALAFGSAVSLPLVILFAAMLMRRVDREERLLALHFGDDYRAYRARTGALWPRLVPPRGR